MSQSEPNLDQIAAALWDEVPLPERSEVEWEQMARRIDARLLATSPGLTSDEVLVPPFPEQPGEGRSPARSEVRLTDLARTVARRKHTARGRPALTVLDGGAQNPQLEPDSERVSATKLSPPAPPARVPSQQETLAAGPARSPERRLQRSSAWTGATIAIAGVAAAVAFYIGSQQQRSPEVSAERPEEREPRVATSPIERAAPGVEEPASSPPSAPPTVESQAEATAQTDTTPSHPVPRRAQRSAQSIERAAPAPTATPASTSAPEEEEEPPLRPATGTSPPPEKPSQGALIAAVANPQSAARSCVAGHTSPSRALLVFGSDGRVQDVTISGPAAGTPAEACLKSELRAARVEPFARASVSVRITIRPR